MATSGSYDFTASRNQILRMAALDVGAIAANETMGPTILQDFNFALNAMVKAWQASGIHVWTTEEATLFPQLDQIKYQLGGTSPPDHATESYVETSISAAEASGQTTISVTSSAGMAVSDNIGIVVDDGTLHWSTISSIPDSTSVVIAAALDDAAAAGNAVFAYTTKIIRPLKVVDARRYDISSDTDTPISMVSRLDYQKLPNKTGEGTVNQAYYDPKRDTGYIYLWQEPSTIGENLVKFTWHRPIQDFDAAGDNPDLPTEWISALRFNLAQDMMPQYPVSRDRRSDINTNAAKYLDIVVGFDREEGSLFMQPDMDGHG